MGKFLVIIGITLSLLTATIKGYITYSMAAFILIASVFLIAWGKSIFLKLLTVAFPIYIFAKEFGFEEPKDFGILILNLLPLFLMLFGFWIMFRGFFKK